MKQIIDCVCIHAWRFYDGDSQEYCEESENPDGWCVYTRTKPIDGFFTSTYEKDFSHYGAAIAQAEKLAKRYGCEIHHY